MAKLTPNEMDFVKTLVNNGTSLEVALSYIGIVDTKPTAKAVSTITSTKVEAKPTTSKEVKPTKVEPTKSTKVDKITKTSKKSSKTKSAKADKTALNFGKVKKGDYFKVFNLADKNNPVLIKVGYAKEVKDGAVTVFTSKDCKTSKKYALENCVAISKKEYHSLSSKLKNSKEKDSAKSTDTPKVVRLGTREYTMTLAFIAKKSNSNVDYFDKVKNENLSEEELKQVRDQIHKDLPELKLGATKACEVYEGEVRKYELAQA